MQRFVQAGCGALYLWGQRPWRMYTGRVKESRVCDKVEVVVGAGRGWRHLT